MVDNRDNDRLDHALRWCRERELKSERLKLFDRKHKKKLTKYIITLAYIQNLRLKKGLIDSTLRPKETLIRLSRLVFRGYFRRS